MAFPPVPFQEWFLRQTSTGNAALNAYVARVKADGGVVEAIGCVPQAVWDWVAPVAPSFVGLLDLYPNAAAAYSLRKLRAAYSGAAVRVRESGGNTEADIGFTSAGELDTAALLAHCGANDGFVTTWYDQSLSNDATQTTANKQPKIVNAGSLVTENGKAAINFTADYFSMNLVSSSTEASIISVYKNDPSGTYKTIIGNGNVNGYGLTTLNGKYNLFYRNVTDQLTTNNALVNSQGLIFAYTKSATNQTIYVNNTLYQNITPPSMYAPTTSSRIGAYDTNLGAYTGIQQELIIFASDQSTNRTGIETNINNFYSIYP